MSRNDRDDAELERTVVGHCIICDDPLYEKDALDGSTSDDDGPFMHRGCGW